METELPQTDSPPIQEQSLDELLAGYNKPMSESPSPDTGQEFNPDPIEQKTPEQSTTLGGQTGDWRGNPLYFQTGKKMGQLRPDKRGLSTRTVPYTEINGGEFLDGEMLVMLIDTVIPMIIGIGHNSFSPYKIDTDDFELTAKQESKLSKLCEKVAGKIVMKGDPAWILVLICLTIYGSQYYALRQEAKQNYKDSQQKTKENVVDNK